MCVCVHVQATKRRWLLMLKAVPGYRDMEFAEVRDPKSARL